jgi:hypothetical protein
MCAMYCVGMSCVFVCMSLCAMYCVSMFEVNLQEKMYNVCVCALCVYVCALCVCVLCVCTGLPESVG